MQRLLECAHIDTVPDDECTPFVSVVVRCVSGGYGVVRHEGVVRLEVGLPVLLPVVVQVVMERDYINI